MALNPQAPSCVEPWSAVETIKELFIGILPCLPYSPDIATNDYHLFRPLNVALSGIHFLTDKEVKCCFQVSYATNQNDYYLEQFHKKTTKIS
jgi:hypothetical protein